MNGKLRGLILSSWLLTFIFCGFCSGEELTLVFTGQTHSMLYTCSCPKEPDGGISRRMTLLKELRAKNPGLLLLDAGNFFGGGLLDEYTQNSQLDNQRTLINLKAMELMKYDAVAIGESEFNFGDAFLEENLAKHKFPALSANAETDKIRPFLIKKAANKKIGITALTVSSAAQKSGKVKVTDPKLALKKAVSELKKQGAEIIILLSNLNENEDEALVKEVAGIDVLVSAGNRSKQDKVANIAAVWVLRPLWQGRRLGKAVLTIKGNKVVNCKTEELRVSENIAEDKEITAILPRCFSDANCRKEGLVGSCQNGGNISASCQFVEASRVPLLVISASDCRTCNPEALVKSLKPQIPGLEAAYEDYPQSKSEALVKSLAIETLPAFLFGKEIEKEKAFEKLKANLEPKGDFYLVKPEAAGVGRFLKRKKIAGRLDLFLSLSAKDSGRLLENIREFDPAVHFLVAEEKGEFVAEQGPAEVEECLRAVCVQKYYPSYFMKYITSRAKDIETSWWDDALEGLDTKPIKACARGQEGKDLLKANSSLTQELRIMTGPTYLVDNQDIFGSLQVPSKEEFKKILGK